MEARAADLPWFLKPGLEALLKGEVQDYQYSFLPTSTRRTTRAACRCIATLSSTNSGAPLLQRQPLVEALLELGADANATDHHGDPLLIIAMSVGSADGALSLIRAGADANARDTIGKSAM